MKTSAIIFLLILVQSISCAQVSVMPSINDYFEEISKKDSIDDVYLRVQYLVTYKSAKEDDTMAEDMQALDIGKRMSKYYSNAFAYAYEHQPSSLLEKENKTDALANALYQSEKYTDNIGMIYKNYPEMGNLSCFRQIKTAFTYSVNQENYYYTENIPKLEWTLEDGDTTICSYTCQKATTTFRGRTWQVWYTMDLPYEDGPWKLGGLPGLILKAEDATGEYQFNAIEIFQPKDRCIKSPNKKTKYEKSSEKKIQSSLTAYYKNPAGYIRMTDGDAAADLLIKYGFLPNSSPRTPCFLEQ